MTAPTRTVAEPLSPEESVAVTTTARPPGEAAVKRPELVIVSPAAPARLHRTLPVAPATLNCSEEPGFTLTTAGETVSGGLTDGVPTAV